MNIYQKLFEIQKEIGKVTKDKENPFYKSKYFDINKLIEHVTPLLQKHNLLLLQPIKDGEVVSTIVDLDSAEADAVRSAMPLPAGDPQKMGSAVTYLRRYTLQSLLALQSDEDDDGNVAKSNNKQWLRLNATDKSGKLNKRGEQTAQRLSTAETTWNVIEKAVQVSKKDRDAIEKRLTEIQQE